MSENVIPRVSIGMPVYNAQRFLVETIEAFLEQTYRDFELIICDNASTDRTQAICEDFASRDTRIQYCRAEKNGGIAWNFNRAVNLARGTYFKWAAHDDLCTPDFLASCVTCLDQHPDAAWCHSWTGFIDDAGRRTCGPGGDVFRYTNHPGDSPARGPGRDAVQRQERFCAVLLGPGECYDTYGMMRLSLLRKTKLQPSYFGGDKVLITELSLLGKFVEIPAVHFLCRQHAAQSVWTSRRDQERMTSGRDPGALVVPRRFRCLLGYLGVIARSHLTVSERAACLAAVARFVGQPRKWKSAMQETLGGLESREGLHSSREMKRSREASP